jgi:hypothetical protein
LNPADRMIHFLTCDEDSDVAYDDHPQVCAQDVTPAQLRATMRALDDAMAESQPIRPRIARAVSPPLSVSSVYG